MHHSVPLSAPQNMVTESSTPFTSPRECAFHLVALGHLFVMNADCEASFSFVALFVASVQKSFKTGGGDVAMGYGDSYQLYTIKNKFAKKIVKMH